MSVFVYCPVDENGMEIGFENLKQTQLMWHMLGLGGKVRSDAASTGFLSEAIPSWPAQD